jgi:diguanylate cyclase (GGDEF)-like protein
MFDVRCTHDSHVVVALRKRHGFGSLPSAPKPVVLLIVYGLFLVVVGVTTAALAIVVSSRFSTTALNEIVGSDASTVRTFANLNLLQDDLTTSLSADRHAELTRRLGALRRSGNLAHVEIRLPDGTIVASEDAALTGTRAAISADYRVALSGTVALAFGDGPRTSEAGTAVPSHFLREYLPVSTADELRAVVGVWRDAAPILGAIDDLRRDVVIIALSGALVVAIFLFFVFRTAQARISRQTVALLDTTRRDPVTGLMNHGAVVTALAEKIEQARGGDAPVVIALVDIDGFRLLNETYGHAVGDSTLCTVAAVIGQRVEADAVVGRYGPDEFLIVADGAQAGPLEAAVEQLQIQLATDAIDVDVTDRVPISVSAGISLFPGDGDAVTTLIAKAIDALAEAKASGGDAIRVAGHLPMATAEAKTFDVFQGLILAVDTKDRYTKRHCEDVARYSVFLARRLGLDEETVRTIRLAGLLHDVGKIGIPDAVLRKPGRLTAEEFRVVKQHVALGDMIVRELPNIDVIRAGVRHHHERWDGTGYLDALAREDIPLVARVLAVADAFSAMTTTRPYRKALSVDGALRRLEDASATQLDPSLVSLFVEGVTTLPDAPLPGVVDRQAWSLGASQERVA